MSPFTTGDIIKATAADMPFVYHSGIILKRDEKLFVAHNTPMKKNADGGNVVVESLDGFLAAGRKIVHRRSTRLSSDQIIASVEAVKSTPFNIIDFNCDDFLRFVVTGKKRRKRYGILRPVAIASRAMAQSRGLAQDLRLAERRRGHRWPKW